MPMDPNPLIDTAGREVGSATCNDALPRWYLRVRSLHWWGGWDSNPRPTDHESFEDLGDPCRSVPIPTVLAGQACASLSALRGPCRLVPVLVVPAWFLSLPERPAPYGIPDVAPAQPTRSNHGTADSSSSVGNAHAGGMGG